MGHHILTRTAVSVCQYGRFSGHFSAAELKKDSVFACQEVLGDIVGILSPKFGFFALNKT